MVQVEYYKLYLNRGEICVFCDNRGYRFELKVDVTDRQIGQLTENECNWN